MQIIFRGATRLDEDSFPTFADGPRSCAVKQLVPPPSGPNTVFYAKTWYLYVSASLCTLLAAFSATFGPLFLFDIIKPANGRPGQSAGLALSIMAVPVCSIALLHWFNVYSRRKPLLRICKEGLEINVIGASSLDGVPLIPGWIRVILLVLSLQGFKNQIGWIPWDALRTVQVGGLPMMRTLEIEATILYPSFRSSCRTARIGEGIVFGDAEFRDPLDAIASAILVFYENPGARTSLPSLVT